MMGQVAISGAGNSTVETADGKTLGVIGGGRVAKGDVAWAMGGFVFSPGEPAVRAPIVWAEKKGAIIVAYRDGTYDIRDSTKFEVESSGTFKYWPTDFLASVSSYELFFAYNESGSMFLLVKHTNNEYVDGDEVVYYTGISLNSGVTLFTVISPATYFYATILGFYVEAVNDSSVKWGGVWVQYGQTTYITSRNYTNASYTETKASTDEIDLGDVSFDAAWEELNGARVVNNAIKTGRVGRNDGYPGDLVSYEFSNSYYDQGKTGTATYADGITRSIFENTMLQTSQGSAITTVTRTQQDKQSYLSYVCAANPKTGGFIGYGAQYQYDYTEIKTTLTQAMHSAGYFGGAGSTYPRASTIWRTLLPAAFYNRDYSSSLTSEGMWWIRLNGSHGIPLYGRESGISTWEKSADYGGRAYYSIAPLIALPDINYADPFVAVITGTFIDSGVWPGATITIYQKTNNNTEWKASGSFDVLSTNFRPFTDARVTYSGGIPCSPAPRVHYDSFDASQDIYGVTEPIVDANIAQAANVTATIFGTGNINTKTFSHDATELTGYGENAFYFTGYYEEQEASWEITWEDETAVQYFFRILGYPTFTFGGIYYSKSGEVPVADKLELEPIITTNSSSVISLPYKSSTVTANNPVGDNMTLSLQIDGATMPGAYYTNNIPAIGTLSANKTIVIYSNTIYIKNGSVFEAMELTEKTYLRGGSINASLATLKIKKSDL